MNKPRRIRLKYKQSSEVFTMTVDEIAGASYQWQFCKNGTALWENINSSNRNEFSKVINITSSSGDKYRCLIYVSNKVEFYSTTLTIGEHKYESRNEYSNYQYQKKDSFFRSAADTDGMDGLEFEKFCADLLRKNGYSDVRVTSASGDYGIDILAKKDDITYAIQCKCYSNPIGNKAVQEAYSGKTFYNCMVAAVLTNNYFTEAAIETAKRTSVVLWNRDYLDQFIKNAYSYTDSNSQYKSGNGYSSGNERSYQRQAMGNQSDNAAPDFFKGCTSWTQVKDRYRKLMQIYHPDLDAGNAEYSKIINVQYAMSFS